MHLKHSDEPARSRAARAWARAAWGLVGAASLAACSTMRGELCTAVHTRVLEELRTTDGAPHHVSDPWACERHARRLRALAEELRALDIQDSALREAVAAYRLEVAQLAEAYERLVAAYKAQPELPPEEARRVHTPLRREVLNHAASLSAPRIQVQNACNVP
jgi:hypothetical protein